MLKHTGILKSLSVQNVLDCGGSEHLKGCLGGKTEQVYQYVIKAGGINSWNFYPYEGKVGKCRYNTTYIASQAVSYVKLPKGWETPLKQAVATVGPISVGIDSRHSSFHFYAKGVYKNPHCHSNYITHSLLVVGYGVTKGGEEYWIVKNSWGTKWGEDGYIRMSRNNNNNCGIATRANYPLLPEW